MYIYYFIYALMQCLIESDSRILSVMFGGPHVRCEHPYVLPTLWTCHVFNRSDVGCRYTLFGGVYIVLTNKIIEKPNYKLSYLQNIILLFCLVIVSVLNYLLLIFAR